MLGRWLMTAAVAAAALAIIIGGRRWVHHARIELIPVIVPAGIDVHTVLDPPPNAIVMRMGRDLMNVVAPRPRARLAVLSFDDGPYPVTTPALLAQLQQLHVPADFFVIGSDAQAQPAIARRLATDGFEIGNHTLSHPKMSGLTLPAQLEEIADGRTVIRQTTGVAPIYFRPPHGDYDAATLFAAESAGQTVALWDIDPGDWRTVSPQTIADHVIHYARSPAVILLHNGKEATIEALPEIVTAYRRAGFEFVTLSELQRRMTLSDVNDPAPISIAQ